MKHTVIFITFITLLVLATNLNAQWNWFNPKPIGSAIYDIDFVSPTKAFACGSLGHIIKTTNGGDNWFSLGSVSSEYLLSLSFINETTGWVFGQHSTILKTTNGASSWQPVNTGTLEENFTSGKLFDENNAVVGCESGKIYLTNDGGNSWTQTSSNNHFIYRIYFYNNDLGFAACLNGVILKTINGGNSWTSYNTGDIYDIGAICFSSENIGYATGYHGFFKTTDGGDNWVKIPVSNDENSEYNFFACTFIDDNHGYICSDQGHVFSTSDGGISWQMSTVEQDRFITFIVANENGNIFVCNESGKIFKSVDDCATWTCQTSTHTNEYINSIAFIDSENGIAVGNKGIMLKTDMGGCAWEPVNFGISYNLTDIIYLTSEKIIVSTGLGKVFLSEDAGVTWTMHTVLSEFYILEMFFVDENTGWAIGFDGSGCVCKTTDGGHTWIEQAISNESDLNDIVFTNHEKGFIATNYGKLFSTEDGGNTWDEISVGADTIHWQSIACYNSDTIIACGYNFQVARSVDGGQNWTINSLHESVMWFEDINLFADGTGYCAGHQGTIFSTSNFGETWTQVQKFTDIHLTKIIRNENMQLFVVGFNGSIISSRLDPRNMTTEIEMEKLSSICGFYPNPASKVITFDSGISDFILYDTNGRVIKVGKSSSIDVSNIESGIYLIQYSNSTNEFKTDKIIIMH